MNLSKILIPIILALNAHAIVNIEPQEVGDKQGVSGYINLTSDFSVGNVDKKNFATASKIQNDFNNSLVFLEFSYDYGINKDLKNVDKIYSHLRYIQKISPNKDIESFAQLEGNEFVAVRLRALVGADIRFNLLDVLNTSDKAYFSTGLYNEYIKSLADGEERNIRSTNSIDLSHKLKNSALVSYKVYYMPKIDEINDYYVKQFLQYKTEIVKDIIMNISFVHSYDSHPATGILKTDFAGKIGFGYEF